MRNSKSVTKSVTWTSELVPYAWAYKPEDVPIWDASRGYPAGQTPYFAIHENIDWEDEDIVLPILRKKLKDSTWKPTDPPSGWDAYPRLVKLDPTNPGVSYYHGEGKDVINEMAEISGQAYIKGDFRLLNNDPATMDKILRLQHKYGHFQDIHDNAKHATLALWVQMSLTINAHLEAMNILNDLGSKEMLKHIRILHHQWRAFFITQFDLNSDNQSRTTYTANPEIGLPSFELNPHWGIAEVSPWLIMLHVLKDKSETDLTARIALADQLIKMVHWRSKTYIEVTPDGGLLHRYYVPMGTWLFYRLSLAWLGASGVKRCDVCNGLFIPKKQDAKTCSPRCRVRKHRSKPT